MQRADQFVSRAPPGRRSPIFSPLLVLCLLAVALASSDCASPRKKDHISVMPPPPPPFLSGAMALLLTNCAGFSADAVLQTGSPADPVQALSGKLLGRGPLLLFALDERSAVGKRLRVGEFSFLWDVAAGRGYLVSEALQAYAPLSSHLAVTNLHVRSARPAAERPDGHTCQCAEVEVGSSDGPALFRVWQAADAQAFPVRITSETPAPALSLSLSRLRLETIPANLFVPPDGFNRYESAENMMAELSMRQESRHRKPSELPVEPLPNPRGPPR